MTSPAIVLTADRTGMARYATMLDGMLATSATTIVPDSVYQALVAPRMPVLADGTAAYPPYGLRKIEAALLREGFSRGDIAITTPEHLHRLCGPETRIIGVMGGDPLGNGVPNTTMSQIFKKEPHTRKAFRVIVQRAHQLAPAAVVIVGGGGSWQLAEDPDSAREIGVDYTFIGYAEETFPAIAADLLAGREVPRIIQGKLPRAENVPAITGPSNMGVIQATLGCGRGCDFCTLQHIPMRHMSLDLITEEIELNVRHGQRSVVMVSEDLFRYGGAGLRPDPDRLIKLFETVGSIKGLEWIELSHANLSSIAQLPDDVLREIYRIASFNKSKEGIWLNVGLETGSADLIKKIAPRKAAPFDSADWPELIKDTIRRMNEIGFFPFTTLVVGHPDETLDDVRATTRLMKQLRAERMTIFPTLYTAYSGKRAPTRRPFDLSLMGPEYWELFRAGYWTLSKNLPGLYWSNQKSSGVSASKRVRTRALGRVTDVMMRMYMLHRMRENGVRLSSP